MSLSAPSVVLQKQGQDIRYKERIAAAAITPGDLLEGTSTDKTQRHSTPNGRWLYDVALEDSLSGLKTIDTDYAADDVVRIATVKSGDVWQANLKAGQSVIINDWLASNGDGKVCKAASAVLSNIVADSATLTSWTTAVAFSNGTVTIPANSLKVGDVIRIIARVAIPSTNSTDTMTFTLNLNSTTLLSTGALNVTNDDSVRMVFDITVRTIGASGTIVGSGRYTFGPLTTATPLEVVLNSTALDTTAAATITVKAAASVSNSGNQAILREFTVTKASVGTGGAAVPAAGVFVVGRTRTTLDLSASSSNGRISVEVAG